MMLSHWHLMVSYHKRVLLDCCDLFLSVSFPQAINKSFIRVVAVLVKSKWDVLAIFLGRDVTDIPQYKGKSDDNFLRAMMVMEDWIAECGQKATANALIRACEECGIHRDNIEAAYKEKS